jgi:hypothetical protein
LSLQSRDDDFASEVQIKDGEEKDEPHPQVVLALGL